MASVGIICVLLVVLLVFVALGSVLNAKGQAQAAADFSALAAAKTHFYQEEINPCDSAQKVAAKNQTSLISCKLDAAGVTVKVTRQVYSVWRWWNVQASARAGPALTAPG